MKKNILITGGAGFIGSNLVDNLIENHNIICIDEFNDFYSPEIKRSNIKNHLNHCNYKLYECDIADINKLKNIFNENKIDSIIHLAARAGVRPSLIDPQLYTRTNIVGTNNLLELARLSNIKKFIFGSSSSVYGSRADGPFNEEMKIDRPISPYAATKASNEQMCYTYSHLYDIKICCLRFFTVYGQRQRPDLAIHKFTKLIDQEQPIPVFGDGKTKRDYTYIADIIQGIISAINYNKSSFEIFNLGESQTIELNYLISLIEKELGKKAVINRQPNQPGDVPITYANISKAKDLLAYNPTTKIESGIKKFIKWYKDVN